MATLPTKNVHFLLLAVCGLTWACGDAEPDLHSQGGLASEPPPESVGQVQTGEDIYSVHCSACHGEHGDGVGLVALDRPARSFLQGGFSFGNTPEAIYRTISNGIGGTPMPGFSSVLSEDERRAVTDYVIAFGPEQIVVNAEATVLVVKERPQVIRGGFPPVVEGVGMTPRGLLLGGLDGLSFQYDASDLRLLAVRQGAFVDRADWGDRGGAALRPLGKIIFLFAAGSPGPMWETEDATGSRIPLRAQLLATEIADGSAWVEYKLFQGQVPLATVRESGKAVHYAEWNGFRRIFEVVSVEDELPVLYLSRPSTASSRSIFNGTVGKTTVFDDPNFGPLVAHRERWMTVDTQDRFTLTEDLLFGIAPTDDNLANLLEELF